MAKMTKAQKAERSRKLAQGVTAADKRKFDAYVKTPAGKRAIAKAVAKGRGATVNNPIKPKGVVKATNHPSLTKRLKAKKALKKIRRNK